VTKFCSLTVNIFLVHQIIQIGKFRLTYPADSVPLSVFRYGQCGLRLLLWEFLECMLSFVQSEESCTDGSASRGTDHFRLGDFLCTVHYTTCLMRLYTSGMLYRYGRRNLIISFVKCDFALKLKEMGPTGSRVFRLTQHVQCTARRVAASG
jgi:hypothetical protein